MKTFLLSWTQKNKRQSAHYATLKSAQDARKWLADNKKGEDFEIKESEL